MESSSAVCIPLRSQVTQISQKLCGVHHTRESSSAMCMTKRSQTAHGGVRIKIFESLWLLLKEQSGEIFLGVNTFIMKDKIWRQFFDFWFDSAVSCTPWNQIFWTLWSNISMKSKLNSKILDSVYQGHRWVWIMEKNGGQKSRDTLPLISKELRVNFWILHLLFCFTFKCKINT